MSLQKLRCRSERRLRGKLPGDLAIPGTGPANHPRRVRMFSFSLDEDLVAVKEGTANLLTVKSRDASTGKPPQAIQYTALDRAQAGLVYTGHTVYSTSALDKAQAGLLALTVLSAVHVGASFARAVDLHADLCQHRAVLHPSITKTAESITSLQALKLCFVRGFVTVDRRPRHDCRASLSSNPSCGAASGRLSSCVVHIPI